jgi:hypothetical protein
MKPYKHLENEKLKELLISNAAAINSPTWVLLLIEEAFNNSLWNPVLDFDGCTLVQDVLHPSPACFIHDFLWRCGYGGPISDEIVFDIWILEGLNVRKARRRWLGVRCAWIMFYKWRNLLVSNRVKIETSVGLVSYIAYKLK